MQSLCVSSGGVGANHNIHWHPEILCHGEIQLLYTQI